MNNKPTYHKYNIFYNGKLLEVMEATNKKNALHFYGGLGDNRLKKDFKAIRA